MTWTWTAPAHNCWRRAFRWTLLSRRVGTWGVRWKCVKCIRMVIVCSERCLHHSLSLKSNLIWASQKRSSSRLNNQLILKVLKIQNRWYYIKLRSLARLYPSVCIMYSATYIFCTYFIHVKYFQDFEAALQSDHQSRSVNCTEFYNF